MMIKLMDRGFAPDAIALSFVADNGDRSGDELSIVEGFSDAENRIIGQLASVGVPSRARASELVDEGRRLYVSLLVK
jgi:hypothetical protein